MKVGDRVRNIKIKKYQCEPIVIIEISEEWNTLRYLIEYLNVFNVQGTKMINWVGEEDITLDIEYYRDGKIEEILK